MTWARFSVILAGLSSIVLFSCASSTCPTPVKDAGEELEYGEEVNEDGSQHFETEEAFEEVSPEIAVHSEVPDGSFYLLVNRKGGGLIEVEVRAKGLMGVSALALSLMYNTDFLELQELEARDVFDEAKKAGIFRAVEVPKGRISIGGAYFGLKRSRNFGDVVLARVLFKIKGQGETKLSFVPGDRVLLDKKRNALEARLVNSVITYKAP